MFYKDRENRRGGGVALYVRDTLQCCLNNKIKTDNKAESIWVDIKEGSQSVVLGVVYRPPTSTEEINTSLWQELNRAGRCSGTQVTAPCTPFSVTFSPFRFHSLYCTDFCLSSLLPHSLTCTHSVHAL